MNILVLIAGVLDPKWPVRPQNNALPIRAPGRLILSPFDEAALEIALKIRDADASGTAIRAIVAGGQEADKLARGVAALNIADVARLDVAAAWDQGGVARALAAASGDADLILTGREFGDCDDGMVPAMVAGLLNRPFFGRVQSLSVAGGVRLMRESATYEEWRPVDGPLLASVTNDRRNRLRKPLMKNVMMARTARIGEIESGAAPSTAVSSVIELAGSRAPTTCRMIAGTAQDQATEIARLLLGVGA